MQSYFRKKNKAISLCVSLFSCKVFNLEKRLNELWSISVDLELSGIKHIKIYKINTI